MNARSTSMQGCLATHERLLLLALAAGMILPLIDVAMIAPALEDILVEFKAGRYGPDASSWVLAAQALAAAATVPITGWLAARCGMRRVWLGGLFLYGCGLLVAALAISLPLLIVGRLLQGAAAGLLAPIMQTIVVGTVARDRVSAAMALISMPTVAAPVFGPMLGGLVAQEFGWRWIFWCQLPCLLIAGLTAARWIEPDLSTQSKRFDLVGFVVLCPGFVLLVHGLSKTTGADEQMVELVGALVLLVGYIVHARRRGASALLDVGIFRDGVFAEAATLLFLSSAVLYGGLLWFPVVLRQADGWSVMAVGMFMAAHGIGVLIARAVSGNAVHWLGARSVLFAAVACALIGGGMVALWSDASSSAWLACAMTLRGAGLGVLTLHGLTQASRSLAPIRAGDGSAVSRMAINLGGAVAVPVVWGAALAGERWGWAGRDGALLGHLVLLCMTLACCVPVLIERRKLGLGVGSLPADRHP